jgi:hypothetical protein
MDTFIPASPYSFRPARRSLRPLFLILIALAIYFLYLRLTTPGSPWPLDLASRPSFTFVPNQGQSDSAVRFQTHSLGANFYFTTDSVRLGSAAQLRFLDTAGEQPVEGQALQPGVVNYLAGANPNQWHSNLPTYAGLAYHGIYPGVDLHWQERDGRLVGTFTAEPGANLQQIRWQYEGVTPQLDETTGELRLVGEGRAAVIQTAPAGWQIINGEQIAVPIDYALHEDRVGLVIGRYQLDRPLTLTISLTPQIPYPPHDLVYDIVVDAEGYAYITGATASGDFPITPDALQPTNGGQQKSDAFIAKLSPDGQTLVFSTYLGGSGDDEANGIVIDSAGQVFITGQTNSLDFPVQNPLQPEMAGDWDAFLTKLTADGTTLVYSTYLGGNSIEIGTDIATDSTGNIYVTGSTWSADFPTANAIQASHGGYIDSFVVKYEPDGSTVSYSTYLGGSAREQGLAIAVSQNGDAFITGDTTSVDFPVINAFQPNFQGVVDAFVARLTTNGNILVYSTYLGGNSIEVGHDIVLNNGNDAFVIGHTTSPDFPIVNGFQPGMSGGTEAFIVELTPQGNSLAYSSFLGGSGFDIGYDIALDAYENIYMVGWTNSLDFPVVNAFQPTHTLGNNMDAFAVKLMADGSALVYSTYLGGTQDDNGRTITVDNKNDVYIAGASYSLDFPMTNPIQGNNAGELDAFISKLSTNGSALEYSTYLGGGSAYPAPTDVTVTLPQQTTFTDRWLVYLSGAITLIIGVIWIVQVYHHKTTARSEDHG